MNKKRFLVVLQTPRGWRPHKLCDEDRGRAERELEAIRERGETGAILYREGERMVLLEMVGPHTSNPTIVVNLDRTLGEPTTD